MPTRTWLAELPGKYGRGTSIEIAVLDEKPGMWTVLRRYKYAASCYPTATRLNDRLRAKGYEFAGRSDNGAGVLYGRRVKK